MPVGSVQQVLICVPKSPNTGNSTAPCTTLSGTRYVPSVISAYVLDPGVTLESVVQVVPFDYTQAGAAFAFGLTMVLTFWLAAKPIGMMLELVKKS